MVQETFFGGTKAFCLFNERIAAVITDIGGKLISLKLDGNEILTQGKNEKEAIRTELGGSYLEQALRGMDDMIPNINDGYITNGPWKGVPLYDHGEVWPLRWRLSQEGECIAAQVTGIHMPFHVKKIFMLNDDSLEISYELSNPTEYNMPCAWAAHTLIIADEETRICLPDEYRQIRATLDLNSRLGGYGALHTWPKTIDRDGNKYALDRLDPKNGSCEKFYFTNSAKTGKVSIKNPNFDICYGSDREMYLGIWINSGGLADEWHIGIEPATAPMDSPTDAKQWGFGAELAPYETRTWNVVFQIK